MRISLRVYGLVELAPHRGSSVYCSSDSYLEVSINPKALPTCMRYDLIPRPYVEPPMKLQVISPIPRPLRTTHEPSIEFMWSASKSDREG